MAKAPTDHVETAEPKKPICGIVMPIAAMPPRYDASHWLDVRRVIDAAIIKADMTPQIVSDSFEGDVIQRRIISNLYDNPVVVCDVSGLNPNVMFELGMRITFKQPVIIVTDDFATIPFDTKVIEHLGYPRDLHIHQTTEFIDKLADRIKRLHQQKMEGAFRSFIEEFGTFEVLEPTKKVVEADRLILDRLDQMNDRITQLSSGGRYDRARQRPFHGSGSNPSGRKIKIDFEMDRVDEKDLEAISDELLGYCGVSPVVKIRGDQFVIQVEVDASVGEVDEYVKEILSALSTRAKAATKSISWR